MTVFSTLRHLFEFDVATTLDEVEAMRRINRRRLKVFLSVLVAVMLCGLGWDFLRPAEYRATARVQINPGSSEPRPSAAGRDGSGHVANSSAEFLTQLQWLNSRPLLAKVTETLNAAGYPVASWADPAGELQKMLNVTAVSGTEVVELEAIGRDAGLVAALLNALLASYGKEMRVAYGVAASETLAQAREETAKLELAVRERQAQIEAFRSAHGVWSTQPEGNEAVERMKGLTTALAAANEKAASAEARLRASREALAAGNGAIRAKDDPTLAAMEQRASTLREEIRDMERVYTPAFMVMDPNARALRARLSELERQIEEQRAASRQLSLALAQEEYMSARMTVDRLQAQLNEQRQGMQAFSARLFQAKALEDDLAQVEKARREGIERLAKLEAGERSRMPSLTVLEPASTPTTPFRPEYWRDALYVLLAAFILALLATGLVELFNRQPRPKTNHHTMVVVPQPWNMPGLIDSSAGHADVLLPAVQDVNRILPCVSSVAPRELSQSEVAALLTAAAPADRLVLALLLMGLSVDEATTLQANDFDVQGHQIHVRGSASRSISVPPWLARCPSQRKDGLLFSATSGEPMSEEDITSVIVCAALDAGLTGAAELAPAVLRHTCIAWLVRQGVRFSNLTALVGRPDSRLLAWYARLAPDPHQLAGGEIDLLMPALRDFMR